MTQSTTNQNPTQGNRISITSNKNILWCGAPKETWRIRDEFPHLSQTREHASHGLVVETLGAVDDNDVHAQALAQVLCGLSFSSSSGPFGAAATVKMKGGGEGHVAAVSERSDDQATRVTQVFIAVLELGIGLLHHAVVILLENNPLQSACCKAFTCQKDAVSQDTMKRNKTDHSLELKRVVKRCRLSFWVSFVYLVQKVFITMNSAV